MIRTGGFLLLVWALSLGSGAAGAETPAAQRIVSLAPHLTELVFEAGAGDRLVGVVEHSDFPAAALDIPRIGDAFRFDPERIAGLAPDLILAWQGGTPDRAIDRLTGDGYRVVTLGAGRPEGVADVLMEIGRLTGQQDETAGKAERYREALTALRQRYGGLSPVRTFVQISERPIYTVNDQQMIGQLVRLCGGRNVFGGLAELAPVVGPEAVIAADPQIILGVGAAGSLGQWREFPSLGAVREGHLYTIAPDLVARASLRLAAGAREMCALIDRARPES